MTPDAFADAVVDILATAQRHETMCMNALHAMCACATCELARGIRRHAESRIDRASAEGQRQAQTTKPVG